MPCKNQLAVVWKDFVVRMPFYGLIILDSLLDKLIVIKMIIVRTFSVQKHTIHYLKLNATLHKLNINIKIITSTYTNLITVPTVRKYGSRDYAT